jgi:hypothetical protein
VWTPLLTRRETSPPAWEASMWKVAGLCNLWHLVGKCVAVNTDTSLRNENRGALSYYCSKVLLKVIRLSHAREGSCEAVSCKVIVFLCSFGVWVTVDCC